MANVHIIDAKKHKSFLAEQRFCAALKEPLKAGDRIVFCAICKCAFREDGWQLFRGSHCDQSETLQEFPVLLLKQSWWRVNRFSSKSYKLPKTPEFNAEASKYESHPHIRTIEAEQSLFASLFRKIKKEKAPEPNKMQSVPNRSGKIKNKFLYVMTISPYCILIFLFKGIAFNNEGKAIQSMIGMFILLSIISCICTKMIYKKNITNPDFSFVLLAPHLLADIVVIPVIFGFTYSLIYFFVYLFLGAVLLKALCMFNSLYSSGLR